MSVAFLVTTLVLVATPGTGVLYTISAGVSRGKRASLVAATGCTLGIVPHMLAAVTGLAAILHTSAVAFQTLKYAGVAFLLYMAWHTFHDTTAFVDDEPAPAPTPLRVVGAGIFLNLLNPKLTIFFFAFLPQFVPSSDPDGLWHMLQLSAVFMVVTFFVFCLYGLFAAVVRDHVISRPRVTIWMRRTFSGAYVILAGRLAVTTK